jgi:putative sterol carrier protein
VRPAVLVPITDLGFVRPIRQKYAGQAAPAAHQIKMNQIITGVPFGGGEMEFYMDTTSGEIVMEKGRLEDADVTITTDYDTAKKILVDQDPQAGMQAFMSGKIKVQGDMMKLMQMQGTPPDETAMKVAQEIKDITA